MKSVFLIEDNKVVEYEVVATAGPSVCLKGIREIDLGDFDAKQEYLFVTESYWGTRENAEKNVRANLEKKIAFYEKELKHMRQQLKELKG